MSRYLTAAKVAYVALIHLYCEYAVPDSTVLDFLSLIVSLTAGADGVDGQAVDEAGINVSIPTSLTVSSITDLEQHPVLKLPSVVPGRSIYDLLLRELWEVDSLDALHEIINTSDALFHPPQAYSETSFSSATPTSTVVLGQRSPLGTFIRRVRLEFMRLQFSDTIQLWLAFITFKEPSRLTLQRQSRVVGPVDCVLQELDLDANSDLTRIAYGPIELDTGEQPTASASDVERLLQFQLDKLQRFGGRVPPEIRSQLKDMTSKLRSTPTLSYFLGFFDAWRAGDYQTSFDSLHRYFDHKPQARDKTHYQYALFHMANLHADFGCFSEAVAAINEAIVRARESQDMACLNYCLNWLIHFRKAHPKEMKKVGWPAALGESEKDGLLFLKSKALDMQMWSLLSAALLSEARMDLTAGESISRVLESLYQSSHILTHYDITQNVGAQLSLQSSVYARIGCGPLSSAHNELVNDCYARVISHDDVVRAACRKASILAAEGSYREAAALLQGLESSTRGSLKTQHYIATQLHMLSHTRAIHRSDIPAANLAIATLKPPASADTELAFEFRVLRFQHDMCLGNVAAASAILHDLAEDCKPDGTDIYHQLTVSLLKARLFAQTGTPQKGFTIALRAAAAAEKVGFMGPLWDAVGLMCETLVELEEFDAARSLLDAIVPAAHEGGDCGLLGRLYAGLADACVGLMGQRTGNEGKERDEDRDRLPDMRSAALFLDRAEQYYQKIEDRSAVVGIVAKQALLAQMRGDVEMANSLAKKVADFDIAAG